MADRPAFFLPSREPDGAWSSSEATLGNQEARYADLAKWCGCDVPSAEKRPYSITYTTNGERWTATVGESLKGSRQRFVRSRGSRVEKTESLSDPAIVLAIFPGPSYIVATSEGLAGNIGSQWVNPFCAGAPKSVDYFAL